MSPLRMLVSSSAVLAVVACATPDASACGSAVREHTIARTLADQADDDLGENDYESARVVAGWVLASPEHTPVDVERATLTLAMGWVRDPEAPKREVLSAVAKLRALRAERPGRYDVALGEALARVPGGAAESRAILEPLAEKDLLGSPHAFAALVRVGSASMRLHAFRRCRETATDTDLCTWGYVRSLDQVAARRRAMTRSGLAAAVALLGTL